MEFTTHNDHEIGVNNTELRGFIEEDYAVLVDIFGKPTNGDEYKSNAQWHILFEDGTTATIYDWKVGTNYLGKEGTETEKIVTWNIGGYDFKAVDLVLMTVSSRKMKAVA